MILITFFSVLTAVKYFTCTDKERCSTLMTIYDPFDVPVYQRALDQTIPACCGTSPPPPKSCTVCRGQDINIICSVDTKPVEVEGMNGTSLPIVNTSSICMYYEKVLNVSLCCFCHLLVKRCLS